MKVTQIPSINKHVIKFVFEFDDGALVEAVLYKYPKYKDRTVICCSVQSGCPVGCTFCGTGNFFNRNLTAIEIEQQVLECLAIVGDTEGIWAWEIDKLQIMFMSMGEPFLNYKALEPALRALSNKYPNAALLVSTSGPIAKSAFTDFKYLSREIPKIGLQFSVHETTEEARNKLIPFKKKMTLEQIAYEGFLWSIYTNRNPYFNYCVHERNSSLKDVKRLSAMFSPNFWECTLSVICERDESVKSSIQRQLDLIQEFDEKMIEAGYNTRVFNPAGQDDVGGGCGQLWHFQKYYQITEKDNESSITNRLESLPSRGRYV